MFSERTRTAQQTRREKRKERWSGSRVGIVVIAVFCSGENKDEVLVLFGRLLNGLEVDGVLDHSG